MICSPTTSTKTSVGGLRRAWRQHKRYAGSEACRSDRWRRPARIDGHVRVPNLENRGGNIKRHSRLFTESKDERSDESCGRPFNMMTVNVKGQVALCCSDLYSDVVMGDVNSHRLEQIWNNESFRHYRSHLDERGREGLPLCGDCSYRGDAPMERWPLPSPPSRTRDVRDEARRIASNIAKLPSLLGKGG